jgi:hypothetical protein
VTALAFDSRDVGSGSVFALLAAIIRIVRLRAIAYFARAFFFHIRHQINPP